MSVRGQKSCVVTVWLLLASHGLAAQELPTAPPAQLGLSAARLEQIGLLVEDAVDRQEVAGAVTLVARLGRVAHLEAVGWRDVEGQSLMETDTLFRIASMTKAVTSVAAMQLYESGVLMLSDPVSKYLPAFAEMEVLTASPDGGESTLEPLRRPITIRHLLTHTSGLSYRFLAPPSLAARYIDANITDGLSQAEGTIGEMVTEGADVRGWRLDGEWLDTGTLSSLLATQAHYLASDNSIPSLARNTITGPVLIGVGTTIENCEIGPNVVIGDHAVVRSTRLRDALVVARGFLDGGDHAHVVVTASGEIGPA